MRRYRTSFRLRIIENGQKEYKTVVVRCSDDDYFFYNLLTKAKERGILEGSIALYAESHFFFNGYAWIDRRNSERSTAADGT